MSGVSVFFSYSHVDEEMRDQLETHLTMMKRNREINTFHDRKILAGAELGGEIDHNLMSASIVLLLVSPAFLESEYCYSVEMKTALSRHKNGQTQVIPIILEYCDWLNSPLKDLLAIPNDGKPITEYANYNKAFNEVTNEIRRVVQSLFTVVDTSLNMEQEIVPESQPLVSNNDRSANLHIKKEFTDLDLNDFMNESFKYIARYIQNTLGELEKKYKNIQTRVDISDSEIRVTVFDSGSKVAFCRIIKGREVSYLVDSIVYSESDMGNSINDSITIDNDGISLFWKPSMLAGFCRNDELLTKQGAAEYFWEKIIAGFQ